MKVLAISGSPSRPSRTSKLIDRIASLLGEQDIETSQVSIYDFPADALIQADFSHAAIKRFQQQVRDADGIIIASPVYKAAYAGALKVMLDLIPEGGFAGKPVLPLVSGGSAGHLLAVDYAIKPVLAALKASDIHQGVFAIDAQIGSSADGHATLAEELDTRLRQAAQDFVGQLPSSPRQQPPALDLHSVVSRISL
ncbi:MAG: NADPH-dependent FMN reductase [Aquitalea sp.]|nr:NADPH-dependent FMN reductase [Aquitalea sp.]